MLRPLRLQELTDGLLERRGEILNVSNLVDVSEWIKPQAKLYPPSLMTRAKQIRLDKRGKGQSNSSHFALQACMSVEEASCALLYFSPELKEDIQRAGLSRRSTQATRLCLR